MVSLGPFDPIELIFSLMNTLMKKGLISYSEAREIISNSLSPNMTNNDKEKLLNSLLIKTNKPLKK